MRLFSHQIKKAFTRFCVNARFRLFSFSVFGVCLCVQFCGLIFFGYIAVCAMYGVVACIFIPPSAFFNSIPLRLCAVKGDTRKTTATTERPTTDTRYAIRYGYARKVNAIIERIIAYTRYTVRYGDTCKTTATTERIIADTRYTVGYDYTRKTTATIERILADTRHAVGNSNGPFACFRYVNNLSFFFIIQYTVLTCIMCVVFIYCYGR